MLKQNANQREQVVCVCGGFGYPRGAGSPARITVVGKALQDSGMDFRLLHTGPSPSALNTERSGVYEGIPFRYTTTLHRPANSLLRGLVYLLALWNTTLALIALRAERKRTVIWLYYIGGSANLYFNYVCRFLGLRTVQELCEWWPGEPTCSEFVRWQHTGQLFRNLAGILVISKLLEDRTTEICRRVNPGIRLYRLPSIVDTRRFLPKGNPAQDSGYFVWCGGEGWREDILYIIQALSLVRKRGHAARLRLVGNFGPQSREEFLAYAASLGLPEDSVILTGYVDDATLERYYQTATALLLPLWDNDRSKTRMPNKLGEYLASGRPVLTSEVGDLSEFLRHGAEACLAKPGDVEDFAAQMEWLASNRDAAAAMGKAGQQAALNYLDYRSHAESLGAFFRECLTAEPSRRGLAHRAYAKLRWATCGLLAHTMIALGYPRRALARLAGAEVITSIYFHDPQGSLFEHCIVWLKSHGYQFVSTSDVIEILRGQKPFPKQAAWISLDDGNQGWKETVFPIVRKHDVPVTLFIPTGIVEGDGLYPWLHDGQYPAAPRPVSDWSSRVVAPRESMTPGELRETAALPQVSLAAHTVNHVVLPFCGPEQIECEIARSKTWLEELTGSPVRAFCYPGGFVDLRAEHYLKECGLDLVATTEPTFITPNTDLFLVPRVCVPDDVTFAEAICNMTGVWRNVAGKIKSALRLPSAIPDLPSFDERRKRRRFPQKPEVAER